jgi:hypothetical protein
MDNFCHQGCKALMDCKMLPPVQPKGFAENERVTPHRLTVLKETELANLREILSPIFSAAFVIEYLVPPTLTEPGARARWVESAHRELQDIVTSIAPTDMFALSEQVAGDTARRMTSPL